MRTYTVHSAEGCQRRALATLATGNANAARSKVIALGDGDYNLRDCLGGLRLRVRVKDGTMTTLERTK